MIDEQVLTAAVVKNVTDALAEDVGSGDVSAGLIPAVLTAEARVITRTDGVFCGRPWVDETVRQVNREIQIDWHVDDGDPVKVEPDEDGCFWIDPVPKGDELVLSDNLGLPGYLHTDISHTAGGQK